jgi:hypothetical protein
VEAANTGASAWARAAGAVVSTSGGAAGNGTGAATIGATALDAVAADASADDDRAGVAADLAVSRDLGLPL